MENLDQKIKELKEAMNKFILEAKDEDYDSQAKRISNALEELLNEDHLQLDEETYIERYASEEYYSSTC